MQAFVLAVVFGLVTLFESRPEAAAFLRPVGEITASLTALSISHFGMPVSLDTISLVHPSGFRFRIVYGCTGIVPMAIVVSSLLFLPVSFRQRLAGIVVGAGLILGINLLRIVGLYYVRANYPDSFDFAHDWVGQGLLILTTVGLLLYWIHVSARSIDQKPRWA